MYIGRRDVKVSLSPQESTTTICAFSSPGASLMLLFYLRLDFIVAALKSLMRKGPDLHIVLSVVLPYFNNTQSLGYGSLLVNVQLTPR